MRGFILTCALSIALSAMAQPDTLWTRYYGAGFQQLGAACLASNGDIIMGGEGFVYSPFYFVRADIYGEAVWTRTYDFDWSDECHTGSVTCTSFGNLLITGSLAQYVEPGGVLWRGARFCTNAGGGRLWSNDDGSTTYKGFEAADGSYTWLTSNGFLNTDALGFINWTRPTDNLFSNKSIQTLDGGFLVPREGILRKFNSDGEFAWSVNYAFDCYTVIETMDGGCALAGESDGNFALLKFDSSREFEWTYTYGGAEYERCFSLIQLPDSGFVLAGETESYGNGGHDIWLLRLDAVGDSLWALAIGTEAYETCRFVSLTEDNGYFVAGTHIVDNTGSFMLIRTEPDATLTVEQRSAVLLPAQIRLTAYPNPFNPITTLTLSLTGTQDVQIGLYDITGRYVKDIAQQRMTAGEHSIQIDAAGLPSGVYFARAQAGAQTMAKKLVLLK